jgi:5-formyl-3-hydroxy-2-methylpyridine 4-carboxylic acid 5-dehydrogenase
MNAREIRNVVVAGAGTMGPGIAAVFAAHGFNVALTDLQAEVLERAKTTVDTVYSVLAGNGFLSQAQVDAGRERVRFLLDIDAALPDADYVVETIPEKLALKQAFFRDIEPKVSATTILASNTSGIPVTQLAAACRHPGRVIGMHWSNPPHIIPVIEVIRGEQTDEQTIAATHDLIERIQMIPVDVLRDVPGFVENRILYAIMREALHLVAEGVATPEAVDTITRWGIGYKLAVIGPLELLDVAGLDIYHSVASYLNAELSRETGVSSAITDKVEAGALGIKTGRGLFEYQAGDIPALMQRRMRLLLDVKKALSQGDGAQA